MSDEVLESPAGSVLVELKRRMESRDLYSVGKFLESRPLVSDKRPLDSEDALMGYMEWLALGEDFVRREEEEARSEGRKPDPRVMALFPVILAEKRNLVGMLQVLGKKKVDRLFETSRESESV